MFSTVKVEYIDKSITIDTIRRFFSEYGTIKKITLPNRDSSHALIEFSSKIEAKKAIKELNNTTINTITCKFKNQKKINPEFVWYLSLLTPDHLWEEDPKDTTQIEKTIVQEKKKNLKYIETLSSNKVTLFTSSSTAQREPVSHITPKGM